MLGPTSVLFGKHIDKLKEDKKKRIFTLPVILGEWNSRWFTIIMWFVQYLLVAGLILSRYMGFAMAVVVFAGIDCGFSFCKNRYLVEVWVRRFSNPRIINPNLNLRYPKNNSPGDGKSSGEKVKC